MTHEPTDEIDLRDLDVGDAFSVEIDTGEQFDLEVVDSDGSLDVTYSRGHVFLTVEGKGVWEQVQDRVESEVLHLRQQYERLTAEPRTAMLLGTVWKREDGAPEEAAEPYYEALGEVETVEQRGGDDA
jgi:hypothetical protein